MNDVLYFPIHRAKAGEIMGVGHLSPRTRTRIRPTFEVQKQREDDDTPLDEHLSGVAHQLLEAWGSRYPLFADFSQFGPEDRTADGRHCAEYFFRCLRQQSMLGIPMTGPESVRGPGYGYIDAVAAIASEDGRGAALRVPFNEFSDSDKLRYAIDDTLQALRLEPSSLDLLLDFETLALLPAESRTAPAMVSVLVDVLREYGEFGFRNIVVCGSSVPDRVNKEYDGGSLRVERTEIVAWQSLIESYSKGLIKIGDNGIIHALEQDVSGPVRPPARIRLSTAGEHVLWRAPRKDYIMLSEKVVASKDFDPELAAWGSGVLRLCARFGRGKGGPTEWVARDTNLHIEVTVRAIESFLWRMGRLSGVNFAEAESFPWDQTLIDSPFDTSSS
jgi:hypothetical protein